MDDDVVGYVGGAFAVGKHLPDDMLKFLWRSIDDETQTFVPIKAVLGTERHNVA